MEFAEDKDKKAKDKSHIKVNLLAESWKSFGGVIEERKCDGPSQDFVYLWYDKPKDENNKQIIYRRGKLAIIGWG